MRVRLYILSFLFSAAVAGGAPAACPPDTPLLKVDGRTVDYSYFEYVKSTIPGWAVRKYYAGEEGNRKLLDKILERQLILQQYEERGFFRRPEIEKQLRRFEVKSLSSLYLSRHLKSPEVSEEEVEEAIRKYYGKKKITPEIRRSEMVNLEAQKLSEERSRIVASVQSKLKIVNLNPESPEDVVATFEGRKITFKEVEPLIRGKADPGKLKNALKTYALYLEALKENLDKTPYYRNRLLKFKEDLAVSAFKRNVLSRVKVSDREIRDYYKSHREEFKTPASARVLVLIFNSEDKAKEALNRLKSGKKLKEAVPEEVLSTSREWTVLSNDKGNPVSMLVFSSKEKFNLLNMPDGRTLLIVVENRKPSRYLLIGDVYSSIKDRLVSEKARELVEKEVAALKEKYAARVLPSAFSCIGKENAK